MTQPITHIIPQREIRERISVIMTEVGQTMFGMEEVSRLCLVALYCGGHVLLEGNPGLGKTKLARTFEKVLNFPYKRIQFTPDLMPTDITGSKMPADEDRRKLIFQKGPIFTNLLLADEINRASPKTQAAMLEAMAEKEVTVQGATHKLDKPFMVIATQNPVDHEGTYPLPEAQADRFMFKILMPYPSSETIRQIIAANTGPIPELPAEKTLHKPEENARVRASKEYKHIMGNIRRMQLSPSLETHIVNLLLATNGHMNELKGLDGKQKKALNRLTEQLFQFGLGPRASENLSLGCKAFTLMFLEDRDEVAGPEALAHIALPTLRHRIKLNFDWEERFAQIQGFELDEDESREGLLDALLALLCDVTAPNNDGFYRNALSRLLRPAVEEKWLTRGEVVLMEWLPCPLSTGLLERYRLKIGHHHRPDLVGGHLMRRKGSSLEFHEFSPYAPGDDIRRVDWQASLRTGEDDAWLIRRFTAEERTTLLISLDLSPSMHLPEGFSKVQIACWLAESLATVGLHYGDRVIFHRLFGTPQNGLMELKTPNLKVMRSQLRKLASYSGDPAPFNARTLDRMLPPASIWIVISDLYFENEASARKLARTMSFAQAGLRWLIVADLNSWPMERALLGLGERRLTGPNHYSPDPDRLYHITDAHLDEVERKINSHKNHFRKQVAQTACDFTRWPWPKDSNISSSNFFRKQFLSDRLLQRMFMRES